MGCEIELKAHISDNEVDRVVEFLKTTYQPCCFLGDINKYDIYWSDTEEGEPILRTRRETDNGTERVLFTQKPLKSKDYCTEYNVENEFVVPVSEWNRIIVFLKGLNLKICRIKYKQGFHFKLQLDGFELHCEILNVKFLGWFIETEICGESLDSMDKEGAEKALYHLLDITGISRNSVEAKGYNKMLKETGHEKG